jgi:hypothetical protein
MPELLADLDAFPQEHRRCGESPSKRGGASMSQSDDLLHSIRQKILAGDIPKQTAA